MALGFVVGNVPGALAGAFAGNRLGAIRDAKGKSVGEVFLGLGTERKAQVRFSRGVPRRLNSFLLVASADFALLLILFFSSARSSALSLLRFSVL